MNATQRPITLLVLLLFLAPAAWAQEELEQVSTDNLGTLQVERDPETGSAHRVYGMTTNVQQYGLPIRQATIPELSRALFRDYADVLKVDPEAFEIEQAETDGELWFVSAAQTVSGVPVYGTEIGYTFNSRGELLTLGAEAYPEREGRHDTEPARREGVGCGEGGAWSRLRPGAASAGTGHLSLKRVRRRRST